MSFSPNTSASDSDSDTDTESILLQYIAISSMENSVTSERKVKYEDPYAGNEYTAKLLRVRHQERIRFEYRCYHIRFFG
jgi:hypothetical protein